MQYQQNRNECVKSYIRLLHAFPNAPAVDVYIEDVLTVEDLTYKEFSQYLSVLPRSYKIGVYETGTKDRPLLETDLLIQPNNVYTIAVISTPDAPGIELNPVKEMYEEIPDNMIAIRFSHLSPTAPIVDITLPNGDILFENVDYKETTEYLAVPPGKYTLQARDAVTGDILLNVPNVRLESDKFLTVYAVGLPGETPPLQVLIPLDGITYLDICR